MNSRERFLRIMDGDTSIRTMKWEFGYWAGTLMRWHGEGLERVKNTVSEEHDYELSCAGGAMPAPELDRPVDYDVADAMGLDPGFRRVPVEHWYYPHFNDEVIEESEHDMLVIDADGKKKRVLKGGGSMPQFVGFPVESREDWEKIKLRLDPDTPGRFPDNWDEIVKELNERDYPLALGGLPFGFCGCLRELMGFENSMMMFYEDPELVQDILDHLVDFWYRLYSKVLEDVTADYVLFWEDMSYKAGPMIDPNLFRKLMVPCYQKMISLFRSKGIKNFFVDTDGMCMSLIEPLMEGGVTGLLPFEGNAGMDVEVVAEMYPDLCMMGGIDKMFLINHEHDKLEEVLTKKIPKVLKRGKYVPFIDHLVPPETSWEEFKAYRTKLNEIIDQCVF